MDTDMRLRLNVPDFNRKQRKISTGCSEVSFGNAIPGAAQHFGQPIERNARVQMMM